MCNYACMYCVKECVTDSRWHANFIILGHVCVSCRSRYFAKLYRKEVDYQYSISYLIIIVSSTVIEVRCDE